MFINNLANKITVARLFFIPVIIIISMATKVQDPFYNYICLIIIVLFGIGDVIDGYIARKYDQVTTLGAFLDPFADKYMVISCYIVLTYYQKLPLWYLLLVFNKEIIILTGWVALFLRTKEHHRHRRRDIYHRRPEIWKKVHIRTR
jgi:CDP-diacylglycerol--glycerol-3-phosphate 3-phosphatidyltransferase